MPSMPDPEVNATPPKVFEWSDLDKEAQDAEKGRCYFFEDYNIKTGLSKFELFIFFFILKYLSGF